MPYITTERVKEIRNQLKKEFPDYKFSVTRFHGSTVSIVILSAPVKLTEREHEQVNVYYIKSTYAGETKDVLSRIYEIANANNGILTNDADYGSVPNFYIDISIGEWDKPFIYTQKQVA